MRVNLGICEVCLLISLLTDWKKKAINAKNIDGSQAMATLLGKEHFIWRGGGRVEAEAISYLQTFFSRQQYTYIQSLLSQLTLHKFS